MAHSYTPGLKVLKNTEILKERRLPLKGNVASKVGDIVSPDDIVANTDLPGNVQMINVANLLNVDASDIKNYMIKNTGESIQKDDLISESNIQISESEEKVDEYVEDKEEVLLSNSNIDNIEEEVSSDNLETETESEITSVHSEDHSEEQVEEELLVKEEPSVRRLSLFDNISTNESEKSLDQEVKTEPVISENNPVEESAENLDKDESGENIEPEFNASTDELDEEFNQETEEELLDIPTFLRRQAN